jgi:long-chain acyl-CoA synthetase
MQLVQEFLESAAERMPEKIALVHDAQRWRYAQIDRMANRLAHGLRDRGVRRGDRVVLLLPNSGETIVALFAVMKTDAVFVLVHPSTKPEKLAHILNDCRATALITLAKHADVAAQMQTQISSLTFAVLVAGEAGEVAAGGQSASYDRIQAECPDTRPPRQGIDQDLACLIYTSGSTGVPKGVMSAHENMVFAADSINSYLEHAADDIVISALPLSFDYGLYQPLMMFRVGGRLVLEKSFAYPAHFLRQLQAEQATGFPGVPTMFALLLQMDTSSFDLSQVRYVSNTGAALPAEHIRQLRQRFSQSVVFSMYGLAETKRTLYLPPDQLEQRPGSVGIAIPGTEVWLVDENDRRLGANQVGELVIRGRHVMRGYWGDPQATAERYRPGPLPGERVCYSGDLFRMDEEGFFYFVGRRDDIIKSRGEKVAPKEIENVLYALPGVVEALVVGVPDAVLGQAIKALIVTRDTTMTEQDVLLHCRACLEDFMVPQYVVFVDELPKTSSGKIQRPPVTSCAAS